MKNIREKLYNDAFLYMTKEQSSEFEKTIKEAAKLASGKESWAVDSKENANSFPDILPEYTAKITAVLAVCLYDFEKSGEQSEEPFLLIGAGFSGIQSYLYQINSKYAHKVLKGRSFFLQLLSDSVVRFLLKELNLFDAHLLYKSGNDFYIIAPNTAFVREKIQAATQTITQKFFDSFGTKLSVAVETVLLSENSLMQKNGHSLSTTWSELLDKIDSKKCCLFSSLIEKQYEDFFSPLMQGGTALRDYITGEEILPDENPDGDTALTLRKDTFLQIRLGEMCLDPEYMKVAEEIDPEMKDTCVVNPANLGFYYHFLKKTSHQPPIFNTPNLGILRMEMDNFDNFSYFGLPSEFPSLSHVVALNRSLHTFFTYFVDQIWTTTDTEKSSIIYSDNDGILLIGNWEVMMVLAKGIHSYFRAFTHNHPAFNLSAGIAKISNRFSIMKGLEISEKEKNLAMNHTAVDVIKNSCSFLNMPLNWDMEFSVVEQLTTELINLTQQEKIPKSFISKIMSHARNAQITNHKINKINVYWILTYDLGRMKARIKNPAAKLLIENCINEVCGNKPTLNGVSIRTDYHALELWSFAAQLTQQ